MQAEGVVRVSSKGQIVIPVEVRRQLGLKAGRRLLVTMEKDSVKLRRIEEIPLREVGRELSRQARADDVDIDALIDEAMRWARKSR